MQNAERKQNAIVAVAFLFVSLVMTPLSLKAIGISPNLSAGVEAWRHIVGVFADSHQPVNAAELLALNSENDDSQRDEMAPMASGLLASVQPLGMALTGELGANTSADSAAGLATAAPSASRCARSMGRTVRVRATAPMAITPVMPVEGIRAEVAADAEAANVVVPIRKVALQRYERAMASYRVDVREALQFLPKDFKLQVRVKTPRPPALPGMTTCDFRKVFSPEKIKQLRNAGWSFSSENASESADKGEL